MELINREKVLGAFEGKIRESLEKKNYEEVAIWAQSICLVNQQEKENIAQWRVWEGWKGNHDQRIEDATCTNCGYEHPVVRGSNSKDLLATRCPKCGAFMTGLLEVS